METQPSQPNDDRRKFIIKSIDGRLKNAVAFAKTCESEAGRSSGFKRRGRWINGLFGGLTALLGIAVTALPDDAGNMRKYIGLAGAIAGSIVATAGQYIDPAKARQRAIDLKNLRIQLENLAEESQGQFLGLQNDGADINQLVNLNKNLMDEFAKLQKEAFDRGVDV